MNAPVEKLPATDAALYLRKDLSLQVASNDQALDVQLNELAVLELAAGCLTAIHEHAPWRGRTDELALSEVSDLGFIAVRLVWLLQQRATLPKAMASLLIREAQRARLILQMIDEHVAAGAKNAATCATRPGETVQ